MLNNPNNQKINLQLSLPYYLAKKIFELLEFQLTEEEYKDLLKFFKKPLSQKVKNSMITFLLCLKSTNVNFKFSREKDDETLQNVLTYANNGELIKTFNKDDEIKQYFINTISELDKSQDILDGIDIKKLAEQFEVFNEQNYLQAIQKKISENETSSVINEDNIKSIIKILQIPRLDVIKIKEIQKKLVSIINSFNKITRTSCRRINFILLLLGLVLIGVGIKFISKYFNGEYNLLFFAGFFLVAGTILAVDSLCGGQLSKGCYQIGMLVNKTNINEELQTSFEFLSAIKMQYNIFYQKDYFDNACLKEFSRHLHKRLKHIYYDLSNGLKNQYKPVSYNDKLRFAFFANSLPKVEVQQTNIDINDSIIANNNSYSTEKSPLLGTRRF